MHCIMIHHQLTGIPRCFSKASTKSHRIRSYALFKSRLRIREEILPFFLLFTALNISWAMIQLSFMDLPGTNALWNFPMISGMIDCSLCTKHFAMILYVVLHRLIGWNCLLSPVDQLWGLEQCGCGLFPLACAHLEGIWELLWLFLHHTYSNSF